MASEVATRSTDNGELRLVEFSPGRGRDPILDVFIDGSGRVVVNADEAEWLASQLNEWARTVRR